MGEKELKVGDTVRFLSGCLEYEKDGITTICYRLGEILEINSINNCVLVLLRGDKDGCWFSIDEVELVEEEISC